MKVRIHGSVIALLAAALLLPALVTAQDLHPSRRPSPMALARITVGDTYLFVVYSRPYLRGRDNIFGSEESEALVPYGKVWRTGANEAAQITFTGDIEMAGQKLAAGTYSLFTTPGESEWTVHLNSEVGLTATGRIVDGKFQPVDLPASEVLAATVSVGSVDEAVDQFAIAFEATDDGADLVMTWNTTQVRVPIAVGD